jgi:hypothetical protein
MAPPSPQVRESTLVTLDVVCDMSYAWLAISDYAPLMRNRIQRNPFSVLKLRATFLKLSSILESPLVRIQQSNSPDEESVSQYYSSEVRSLPRSATLWRLCMQVLTTALPRSATLWRRCMQVLTTAPAPPHRWRPSCAK